MFDPLDLLACTYLASACIIGALNFNASLLLLPLGLLVILEFLVGQLFATLGLVQMILPALEFHLGIEILVVHGYQIIVGVKLATVDVLTLLAHYLKLLFVDHVEVGEGLGVTPLRMHLALALRHPLLYI